MRHDRRRTENGRILRISGSKDTTISQWNAVSGPGLYRASVVVRGKVSPGTIVALEFAWLDQEYRYAVRRLAQFCTEHRDAGGDPLTTR